MDRFYNVVFTVPAATPITAPITQAVPLENATLVDIELIIPSGHVGLTGIRVRASAQQVLPWDNNSWIIGDNYIRVFPYNDEIGSRTISIQGYNTDIYLHTFTLRFHLQTFSSEASAPGQSAVASTQEIVTAGIPSSVSVVSPATSADSAGAMPQPGILVPALTLPPAPAGP